MTQILFALEWLPSYRLPLLEMLRTKLSHDGIAMNVAYGQAPGSKADRGIDRNLSWGLYRENRIYRLGPQTFCSQPVADLVRQHDVVIVQQEAALWLNAKLALGIVKPRLGWAMWGHGAHFIQQETSAPAEWLKRWETRKCDHFFAYTRTSKECVLSLGLREGNITIVNNTLATPDTGTPSEDVRALAGAIRDRTSNVGIMISSLDKWKRVPFLIEVLQLTRAAIPDFEFIVIGAGDYDAPLRTLANEVPWLHLAGNKFDSDKAALASVAKVTIHPGLVGLHIIDAFRLQCPMVTTPVDFHSHEIDYLESGFNGVMTSKSDDPAEMSQEVVRILQDETWRSRLIAGGEQTMKGLAVDASVDRFRAGIKSILARGLGQ